jgi:hypothetical protein
MAGKFIQGENDNVLEVSHNILNTWKFFFYQLLNARRAIDVWWATMHTAESSVPDLHSSETETDVEH